MKIANLRQRSISRMAVGLIAFMLGWLLLLNMLIHSWPRQAFSVQAQRAQLSQRLAAQTALWLQSGDQARLAQNLKAAVYQDQQINSLAIQTANGKVALMVGDHAKFWNPTSLHQASTDLVRVNLEENQKPWGELQIAFKPVAPQRLGEWLQQPIMPAFFLLSLGGAILVGSYLRRLLNDVDPASTIPDRVSVAFDAFSEGVMMVDHEGRIVLANAALRNWIEEKGSVLFGNAAKDQPWLKSALSADQKNLPWLKCMSTREAIRGLQLEIEQRSGGKLKAIANCTPIMDASAQVRGCLMTFNDVTELDRINVELRSTMNALVHSRVEIENQNTALRLLATRDPLTSCLNRRSFFEDAEKIYAEAHASGRPLSCIMSDIDHFKQFNDQFGHAMGDKVLIAVSRALFSGLRAGDLLCRYGGEEFCILLPDTTTDIAFDIAERLRIEIETQAGASIRNTALTLKVRSSFGLATLSEHACDLAALIDEADQALYAAKEGGRNCVRIWMEHGITSPGEGGFNARQPAPPGKLFSS